uniref:Uncharacterized protein n=1 Tax=Myoviridae sp. ctHaT25 TaxID=2826635 RepID=A0A8S5N9W9_9CAUD|nr:MAG TPA: hypothetical protein [Myoviridae sp. ctHaT25]
MILLLNFYLVDRSFLKILRPRKITNFLKFLTYDLTCFIGYFRCKP